MTFEVWMRLASGDKVQAVVSDVSDVERALDEAREKYNVRLEDIRELRILQPRKVAP